MKDANVSAAFGLEEMIKGWIRGQGEFNLANKGKLAWNEIGSMFCNICETRRIPILCTPFCKGITKSKEDVESIAVPKFIKSESTADIYINGEIQGGAKAGMIALSYVESFWRKRYLFEGADCAER